MHRGKEENNYLIIIRLKLFMFIASAQIVPKMVILININLAQSLMGGLFGKKVLKEI